ncbi:MAG: hypothetical protein GY719_30585 [bacterium]|nr:hypothetical protein [bacterium]
MGGHTVTGDSGDDAIVTPLRTGWQRARRGCTTTLPPLAAATSRPRSRAATGDRVDLPAGA